MLTRLQPFRGEQWVRYISWRHELGSSSPGQHSREAWCLAEMGGGSCSRRGTFGWYWWPGLTVG